jgi:drug/metabolite transporter (DMT)-like permease
MNKYDRILAIGVTVFGIFVAVVGLFTHSTWGILMGVAAFVYVVYLMVIDRILRKKYGQE